MARIGMLGMLNKPLFSFGNRIALTCNLKDDKESYAGYKAEVERFPKTVLKEILATGVSDLNIYCFGTRLVITKAKGPNYSDKKW